MTWQRQSVLIVAGVAGVATVAGLLVAWFLLPSRIVSRNAVVPALRGVTLEYAVTRLSALGLRGRMAGTLADPLTPRGTVSWQSPPEGTVLPEGTVVRLGASTGPPLVVMPDVTDLDLVTAQRVIEAAGLRPGAVDVEASGIGRGIVLRTRPNPRTAVRAGATVQITISGGPREVVRDSSNRP